MVGLHEIDKINYDKLVYYNIAFAQSMQKLNTLIHSFMFPEESLNLFNQLIAEINEQSNLMKLAVSNIMADDAKSKESVIVHLQKTQSEIKKARKLLSKSK